MNTKYLTLFAAILIYFTVAPDIESENTKLINSIRLIEHKISIEENASNTIQKTQQLLKSDSAIDRENRTLFIDAKLPDALAYAQLQHTIHDDANLTKIELTNLSWGEPSTKDGSPYTLLPLSISFKGSPQACADFLNRLYRHTKLVTLENLSIIQYQNSLSLVADLYTYKRNETPIKSEKSR